MVKWMVDPYTTKWKADGPRKEMVEETIGFLAFEFPSKLSFSSSLFIFSFSSLASFKLMNLALLLWLFLTITEQ